MYMNSLINTQQMRNSMKRSLFEIMKTALIVVSIEL